ncbi:MAG: sugar nucleotide-binding protein [Actinomycetota bacterium]|nr:sugar nucleotide-binding protein [Actinomycetota bacterium]
MLSGHDSRIDDLDRIADLGIRVVRYPVLWERTERHPGQFDWSWSDQRLDRLRSLGIEPIAGLVHHGSGPRWTDLLDRNFPSLLATYAGAVAERYPWIRRYTIVNEPLTTARFSCLYGHWYPHRTGDREFVTALLNQCRAIVSAMEAIRLVRPDAELIQTEDISLTTGGPTTGRHVEFYNERRWLTYDLLSGRVTRHHALWQYLRSAGADEAELAFFVERACPPDVIGLNYYVTSDRYLDDRAELYPPEQHHHTADSTFVDIEAVRGPTGIAGHQKHIVDTWQRYHVPIAVTEVHLGCSRDEQLRWLLEAWHAGVDAVSRGVDVRAITVWALFGALYWDSLVVRETGQHETGAFDTRAGGCRPTAIAAATKELARGARPTHPAAHGTGWWHTTASRTRGATRTRPLLITGGGGTLGRALVDACRMRGLDARSLSRRDVDLSDTRAVESVLDGLAPWAVVNAAGFTGIDRAERDAPACWRDNVDAPVALARAAAARGLPVVTFSSDLVFDGLGSRPYVESDIARPLGVYGASKAAAEVGVLEAWPRALVIRTAGFFGENDGNGPTFRALLEVQRGQQVEVPDDFIFSPTYVPELASTVLDLLIDDEHGLVHVANAGSMSWLTLTAAIADAIGLDSRRVTGRSAVDLGMAARRPPRTTLGSVRGGLMSSVESAIARCAGDIRRRLDDVAPVARAR